MSDLIDLGAEAMRAKRRELIAQPLDRIWSDLMRAAIAAMPGWQPVETYPADDSVVLVANPAEGTLPVIAWRIEDAWFAYHLSKREPLNPQPTIWMAWPKMPRAPAPIPHDGEKP